MTPKPFWKKSMLEKLRCWSFSPTSINSATYGNIWRKHL
jgi:hypothetical protein